jgi:dTDP-glucose 4,6-dehydratase
VRFALESRPAWRVINYDLLTYAGNLENLAGIKEGERYRFVRGDVTDKAAVRQVMEAERPEAVINFAAESHVDRSIKEPERFVQTNSVGTQVMLSMAREYGVRRFLQVSTDEVYGALGATGKFTEQTPLAPNSPYAASKAAADLLCRAAQHTFKQDVVITRCSNNYGPYQFPEKLIPLMISNALEDKPLPVYGDGKQVRDWLHVRDHCEAIATVLERGKTGEVYNIGGNNEWENLDLVKLLLKHLGKPESLIKFVADRPGHDRRYAIDQTKIARELGWQPRYTFEVGLGETIAWYQANRAWWERIKSGEYRKYYAEQYSSISKQG